MDPFSVTVGSLALIQASLALVEFLKSIQDAVADVNHVLKTLIAVLESLDAVTNFVRDAYKREMARAEAAPSKAVPLTDQWNFCGRSLHACEQIAEELIKLFEEIYKNTRQEITGKRDALRISHRRHDKDGKLQRLRADLAIEKNNLSILLMTINV
jgi:hypothetical protein